MKDAIDYSVLREVLKSHVEDAFNKRNTDFHNLGPQDISFIKKLTYKGERAFPNLIKELNTDTELQQLIDNKSVDGIVETIVKMISKYEWTDIPAPSDDYDDWWGDFNQTINYLSWTFKTYKNY